MPVFVRVFATLVARFVFTAVVGDVISHVSFGGIEPSVAALRAGDAQRVTVGDRNEIGFVGDDSRQALATLAVMSAQTRSIARGARGRDDRPRFGGRILRRYGRSEIVLPHAGTNGTPLFFRAAAIIAPLSRLGGFATLAVPRRDEHSRAEQHEQQCNLFHGVHSDP